MQRMLNKKNKNTFKEFIQGNGFYVLTGVVLIAVVVTAMILPRKGEGDVAKEPDKYAPNQAATAAEDISQLRFPTLEPRMDQEEVESDVVEDEQEHEVEITRSPEDDSVAVETDEQVVVALVEDAPAKEEVVVQVPEEIVAETFNSTTANVEELFHADDELFAWPVEEKIIYGYSDNDIGSSFMNPTLDRTMRSFGLFLQTEENAKVSVASQGTVLSVINYPTAETPKNMDYPQVGLAVIVDHGNDWKTVYGLHTGEATVKAGDLVQAGDVIGSIGKPSKDFSVTGPNLYFQVLKNDLPVNPKDMLK